MILNLFFCTELIRSTIPDESCEPILDYFNRNWLEIYEPSIWNHFSSVDYRTNNICEGYHSKINKMLRSKPSLYQMITLFKQLEFEYRLQQIRIYTDQDLITKKRKKKDTEKDLKIELIKQSLVKEIHSFEEFFEQMCYQVK